MKRLAVPILLLCPLLAGCGAVDSVEKKVDEHEAKVAKNRVASNRKNPVIDDLYEFRVRLADGSVRQCYSPTAPEDLEYDTAFQCDDPVSQ
jgi:hypothetical protein